MTGGESAFLAMTGRVTAFLVMTGKIELPAMTKKSTPPNNEEGLFV